MALKDALLAEYDREMANTRKTLARIPDEKFSWRPHQKSWTLGELATHIANLPNWAVNTLHESSFDIAPAGGEQAHATLAQSRQEVLDRFDRHIAAARAAIASATDARLLAQWTLLSGGKKVFAMPRIAVLRNFFMNHIIHHRGQLTVYLRLNDLPVPALYGPSADEGPA